jgi:hypothetical protein
MGTKRPLIIQMINDQSRNEPYCRFKKEEITSNDQDQFETRDIPVSYLCEEIGILIHVFHFIHGLAKRTDALVGRKTDRVSSKPIILRVEYKNCANLTIIDTPGYRLGYV